MFVESDPDDLFLLSDLLEEAVCQMESELHRELEMSGASYAYEPGSRAWKAAMRAARRMARSTGAGWSPRRASGAQNPLVEDISYIECEVYDMDLLSGLLEAAISQVESEVGQNIKRVSQMIQLKPGTRKWRNAAQRIAASTSAPWFPYVDG